MNDGKELEDLVKLLERSLGGTTSKVESRVRLPDKVTGSLREHDVLVTITQSHHITRIALECRDRASPVGVAEVEAFHTKCNDTGIQQGIIVSSTGFASTAITKATFYGIRCLTLKQVETLDWCVPTTMTQVNIKPTAMHFECIPETVFPRAPLNFQIEKPDGTEITREELAANTNAYIRTKDYSSREAGIYDDAIMFETPGGKLRDMDTQEVFPLKSVFVTYSVSVLFEQIPIQKVAYVDTTSNAKISESAIISMAGTGFDTHTLVLRRLPSGETSFDMVLK